MKPVMTMAVFPLFALSASTALSAFQDVPHPDTYMVLLDSDGNYLDQNDNDSMLGNGWASGIHGVDATNGFADNGDGTFSLHIGVTGRPDGLDGIFNGLFQNGYHGQNGPFMVVVQFFDALDQPTASASYKGEFTLGGEAVLINFDVPAGSVSADIDIKNDFPFPCQPFDLNFDPVIDTADLAMLISEFGLTPDPTPVPDVVMFLKNKLNDPINSDDNSSTLGDGLAPGLFGIDTSSGIVINGDGTFSIRTFITGVGDSGDGALDGLVNGAPHGELGRVTVFAEYYDSNGLSIGTESRSVEFQSGSEAFYVNFEIPIATVTADVQVDNTVGGAPLPADFNEDGAVDTADLGSLIGSFGDVCEP